MNVGTGASVPGPWWATLSGLCAILVGIGLSRFAYTPLLPSLIEAEWFTPAEAAYLGAANLAGYLAGALLAHRVAALAPASVLLRIMMLGASASFVACAHPASFAWFFGWRCAAGLASGILMVLAAPTVLRQIPAFRQGLAGGAMFMGVGIGIVLSGTALPLLLQAGLSEAWYALAAISLGLTLISWRGWPQERSVSAGSVMHGDLRNLVRASRLHALLVGYALSAVGLVPHMVFLVDFIARGLDRGIDAGAGHWALFGMGAIVGPVLFGHVADRIGFKLALRLAYVVQAGAVALLTLSTETASLIISSAVVGAFVPGITVLTLGRLNEVVDDDDGRRKAWSLFTLAFAMGQACAAYGYSYIFSRTAGAYPLLFVLASGALALAFAIDLVSGRRERPDRDGQSKSSPD